MTDFYNQAANTEGDVDGLVRPIHKLTTQVTKSWSENRLLNNEARAGTTAAEPLTALSPRSAIQSSFGRSNGGTNRLGAKVPLPETFAPSTSNPACAR